MHNPINTVIIGAGFGGIIAALRLMKEEMPDFLILERAGDIGGTWRDNIYPGCACDIPSPLYSISSDQHTKWSHFYSS